MNHEQDQRRKRIRASAGAGQLTKCMASDKSTRNLRKPSQAQVNLPVGRRGAVLHSERHARSEVLFCGISHVVFARAAHAI